MGGTSCVGERGGDEELAGLAGMGGGDMVCAWVVR